jgi:hypothetical protein
VVLKVQKQPEANTLELTQRLDVALDELASTLPPGVSLYRKGFRQADFIRVALDNVMTVLRDGAILVAIVLALFLMSWRTTLISLVSLPLSLLAGLLVLHASGASINTMTLGGFAIGIGELVDDAIIDVENVYRRLRENALLPVEQSGASASTWCTPPPARSAARWCSPPLIILLVFAPLFFLSGHRGPPAPAARRRLRDQHRRLAGGGADHHAGPVPAAAGRHTLDTRPEHESFVARHLKRLYGRLSAALRAPLAVAALSVVGAVAAWVRWPRSGGRSCRSSTRAPSTSPPPPRRAPR